MLTIEFGFYQDIYRGSTEEKDFNRLTVKATAYLGNVTYGKCNGTLSPAILQCAKLALCAVVDVYLLMEQGGGVASESNDGISVTYLGKAKSEGQRLYEAAALFLSNTGLLYRGVY